EVLSSVEFDGDFLRGSGRPGDVRGAAPISGHGLVAGSVSRSFFFNDTAPTEIYTLSLHDALPISWGCGPSSVSTWNGCGSTTARDRKSTRLNSSHLGISYAVFCLKKKKKP